MKSPEIHALSELTLGVVSGVLGATRIREGGGLWWGGIEFMKDGEPTGGGEVLPGGGVIVTNDEALAED